MVKKTEGKLNGELYSKSIKEKALDFINIKLLRKVKCIGFKVDVNMDDALFDSLTKQERDSLVYSNKNSDLIRVEVKNTYSKQKDTLGGKQNG